MRLPEDVKRAVVFLGVDDAYGKFVPKGTGFFIYFDEARYLVTVRHVAKRIGSGVFVMGINTLTGTGGHITFDPQDPGANYRWYLPDDPTVDLAIIPMNVWLERAGYDSLMVPQAMLDWEKTGVVAGIGDVCQAVGLFSRFPGKTKHIPVVHTGNLSSLADGEKITVRDRSNVRADAEMESNGYLVELANLPGLSGAPVFFRQTHNWDISGLVDGAAKTVIAAIGGEPLLIGVWTGSWEGFETGTDRSGAPDLRVPVGMGFVTPVSELIELLQSGPVVEERNEWKARLRASSASEAEVS